MATIRSHFDEPSGSALAEWMTTKEVARYLRCSSKTVLRLPLPCARVGKRLRVYRKADVTTYLERRVG